MARPRTEPYTAGKISCAKPDGAAKWTARASYRDIGGRLCDVTATGTSKAKAELNVKKKINAARDRWTGGDDLVRHDTPLVAAAKVWLDWKEREELRPRTMYDYRSYVKNSIETGKLQRLTVVQANDVALIESWLTEIADSRGKTAADQSRKVLSQILQMAERRGAIPASVLPRARTPRPKPGSPGDRKCKDEECDYDCGKQHLDTRRALTMAEAIAAQTEADNAVADVGDLIAFLFNTGVRISEALHCTSWADLDFDAKTIRVRGTKTRQADRVLQLSDDVLERLRFRAKVYGTEGLIFGITRYDTKLGLPRDRDNVSKVVRRTLNRAGLNWAGTHTFRRTVASWMDADGSSLAEIANQLGHADTYVTAGYLGRKTQPTRAASVMVLPKPDRSRLRVV